MIGKVLRVLKNAVRFLGMPCWRNLLAVETTVRVEKARRAVLRIGRGFRARQNVELNVRGNAQVSVGDEVFMNSGCIITAREKISIGDHTIFGPNVIVYDHDHRIEDGHVLENDFVTEAVTIGHHVWIGAGSIILKGSCIEDHCVIAAGSIVKGKVPSGSILVQKREKTLLPLK